MESDLFKSARNLELRFRSNWFTLAQILKKTNVKDPVQARQLMNYLELKGLAVKVDHKGEDKYKISIPKEKQIANLELQIQQLDIQRQGIVLLIERLQEAA